MKYDREKDEFKAEINPFGSYHGKQNRRPTWGNGQGYEASLISGEQYHSAAPTYNGTTSRFALMIGFFDGDHIPEQMKGMLDAHANPARIYGMKSLSAITANKAVEPVTYQASIDGDRVTFSWKKNNPDTTGYILRIGSQPGRYTRVFRTKETRLTLGGLSADNPFEVGQRYYAVIETMISGQDSPVRTKEFCLDILSSQPDFGPGQDSLAISAKGYLGQCHGLLRRVIKSRNRNDSTPPHLNTLLIVFTLSSR